MAKFQIITQKPASRCEVCHQTDLFDPQTGHCSRCAVMIRHHSMNIVERTIDRARINLNSLITDRRQDPTNQLAPDHPIGVTVRMAENELFISYFNWQQLIGFFLVMLLLVLIFFNSLAIPTFFYWHALLLGGCLLPLCCYNLVRVSRDRLTIISTSHFPNLFRVINTNNLSQIFIRKESVTRGNQTLYYFQVAAINNNGRITPLLLTGNLEIARFIERQIEQYLGIVDRAVAGEEPK